MRDLIQQSKQQNSDALNNDIERHFSGIQAMIAEERSELKTERDRLYREHKPVSSKIQAEMNALDTKRAELHDLAYQAAKLRSQFLAPQTALPTAASTSMIMGKLTANKIVGNVSQPAVVNDTESFANAKEVAVARVKEQVIDHFAHLFSSKKVPDRSLLQSETLANGAGLGKK